MGFRHYFKQTIRGGLIAGSVSFCAYPYLKTDTQFRYQPNSFNEQVLQMSNSYLKNYMPPLFYSGKLRQTLFNVYVSKDKHLQVNYRREMLTLPDGGSVSLDWA